MTYVDAVRLSGQVLDLAGSFAFALSGAMVAVKKGLDLFGIWALAFATAVSGGIARDVLLGAVPPAALANWHYLALSLLACLLTFWFHSAVKKVRSPVEFFDALGLASFAVVGTKKALLCGLDWPMAAILGMLNGIGGGMVRDVLSAQVPGVLSSEVYAISALAGALVVALGSLLPLPSPIFTALGAGLCLLLRLVSLHRGWRLPSARP